MKKVLLIHSKQYGQWCGLMLEAVLTEVNASGYEYECFTVPSPHHIPTALSKHNEASYYAGSIAVGAMMPDEMSNQDAHLNHILASIYDFSSYYGHCVGSAIVMMKTGDDLAAALQYARNVARDTCEFLKSSIFIDADQEADYASHKPIRYN